MYFRPVNMYVNLSLYQNQRFTHITKQTVTFIFIYIESSTVTIIICTLKLKLKQSQWARLTAEYSQHIKNRVHIKTETKQTRI